MLINQNLIARAFLKQVVSNIWFLIWSTNRRTVSVGSSLVFSNCPSVYNVNTLKLKVRKSVLVNNWNVYVDTRSWMVFVVFSLEHRSIFCAEIGTELWKESHLYSIQTIRQHQVWNFSLCRQGKITEKKRLLQCRVYSSSFSQTLTTMTPKTKWPIIMFPANVCGGKTSYSWFFCCLWLAELVVRIFQANHEAR